MISSPSLAPVMLMPFSDGSSSKIGGELSPSTCMDIPFFDGSLSNIGGESS